VLFGALRVNVRSAADQSRYAHLGAERGTATSEGPITRPKYPSPGGRLAPRGPPAEFHRLSSRPPIRLVGRPSDLIRFAVSDFDHEVQFFRKLRIIRKLRVFYHDLPSTATEFRQGALGTLQGRGRNNKADRHYQLRVRVSGYFISAREFRRVCSGFRAL